MCDAFALKVEPVTAKHPAFGAMTDEEVNLVNVALLYMAEAARPKMSSALPTNLNEPHCDMVNAVSLKRFRSPTAVFGYQCVNGKRFEFKVNIHSATPVKP